jgi:diguanylate cyclase (GGDEF)-like protein
MAGYMLQPTGRGRRPGGEPVDTAAIEAAQAMLAALPFPALWIGPRHEVLWRNAAATDTYGDARLPCYRLIHGHEAPCDRHGEPCTLRAGAAGREGSAVPHLHEGIQGQGFYKVVALRVRGGGALELHWPLDEVLVSDVLTGVHTRRFFEAVARHDLELLKRMGEPFSLLMLDVDGLKTLNDRHGHAAGDAALRAVGRSLRAGLRASDVVGRLGGDEFCALLPGTRPRAAASVARRVRAHLRAARPSDLPASVRLSVSVGVAGGSRGYDLEAARRAADQALYRAKAGGRDRVALAWP